MDPGIYRGVYSKGTIPKNAIHTELDHVEQHGRKVVEYYRVWGPTPGLPRPAFQDDSLNIQKVQGYMDDFLVPRRKKKKVNAKV